MANNRMYLVFKPTGDKVYLGKRMGYGWYNVPDDIQQQLTNLFEVAENSYSGSQDDFCIGMEEPFNDCMVEI
jgi:hypothetical protein